MPLKKRRGSGGFYKKSLLEDLEMGAYIVIGLNKKTQESWEQEKYTNLKLAKNYVDNNTKDDIEYYVYLKNNSNNRIVYPIG
jgi:hypothetical protein